jgi:hypothetical protein
MLIEIGEYREAQVVLEKVLRVNPEDREALFLEATAWYWQGYVRKGLTAIKKINFSDSPFPEAAAMKSELLITNALKTSLDANYIWDDQPLERPMLAVQAEKWHSPFFHPRIAAGYNPFSNDSTTFQTYIFSLDNLFGFNSIGLKVHPSASVFHSKHPTLFLWDIFVGKRMLRHFELQFGWERSVYPHTITAIEKVLTFDRLSLGLEFHKQDSWLGEAAYWSDDFEDGNQIKTAYTWLLSPPLKFSRFGIRVGYGFNMSDAKENRFESVEMLEQILIDYIPDEQIDGIYDPYFTPEDQFTHSGLVSIRFSGNNNLVLELGGSYGFYGRTDQPYIYLDEENSLIGLKRGFYETDYHPVELQFSASRPVSQSVSLSLNYAFLKTLFYRRHSAGLQITRKFLPDA